MPKTAEITLYRYRELPDDGTKDAAKHHVGEPWYDLIRSDERDVAGHLLHEAGLPFDPQLISGNLLELWLDTSCCQGSGASVTGTFTFAEADECEALVDIVTDYPQFNPAELAIIVTHNTHHYVHEYTMSVEIEWNGDAIILDLEETDTDQLRELGMEESHVDQPLSEMADAVTEYLRKVCHEAHAKALEVTLSDSDGYIDEWMDDQGYWFDEDGQIIRRDND